MIKDSMISETNPVLEPAAVQTRSWRELVIVMSLFAAGILTRIPFTGRLLYHWDSINFAFSLERFDVAAGQPHVPGYILYVFLGRILHNIFGEAQLTFAAISVISSGLAAASLYLLGRDMFNRFTGLAASLFLLSSPLFWFYGEIALPHSLDTFAVIFSVWLLYQLVTGKGWFSTPLAVVAAAVWLGIAGGLRPQTQVFLLPLALFAAWRIGWRRSLLAFVVLVLVDLAWFIPLVALNGGIERYFSAMSSFSESFNSTTSIFSGGGLWGLGRNVRKLAMYTIYGWGAALVPFMLAAAVLFLRYVVRIKEYGINWLRKDVRSRQFADPRFWVLALWFLPVLAYYTFIHMGQQGLVFVYLPGLLLLSAAGLFSLFSQPSPYPQALLGALIAINAYVFLGLPTYPLGSQVKILTLDTIRQYDESNSGLLRGIEENFSSENTVVIASWWRFPQYYLPEYSLINFDIGGKGEYDEGRGSMADETVDALEGLSLFPDESGFFTVDPTLLELKPDRNGYHYLLVFDQDLNEFNLAQSRLESHPLPNGGSLSYIRFTEQEQLYLGPLSFGIVTRKTEGQ
jgi:hypothetical protein